MRKYAHFWSLQPSGGEGAGNHPITHIIIIISTGFCYKRNNYSNDKGLKDNGYFPKEDKMTEMIYEAQRLIIIVNMY